MIMLPKIITDIIVDGKIKQTALKHNNSGAYHNKQDPNSKSASGGENDEVQLSNEPQEG